MNSAVNSARQFATVRNLVPAFFIGSPVALIASAVLFQMGVMSAGVALVVMPVITTLVAMRLLRRM